MTGKTLKGHASIQVSNGWLRIRFPRNLFDGKVKVMALGLSDTKQGRQEAERKLAEIQSDILFGRFDSTLDRYRPQWQKSEYRDGIEKLYPTLTLMGLWRDYLDYKRPLLKESTLHYLENAVTAYLDRSGVDSPYNALELREWLLKQTTEGQAKRVLTHVNAAFKWGLKHDRVKGRNPYEGMASELKHNYERDSEPNAFTPEEKTRILSAFASERPDYYPFVYFLFATGCRPSEAIGLRWGDVAADCSRITFDGGIYRLSNGKAIRQKGSKNNKRREFPCNAALKSFIEGLRLDGGRPTDLIFPSPQGKVINYANFSSGAWDRLVNPVKPDTTPYSCRDTFITEQVAKGIPIAVVAKWVDNSATVIERSYFDAARVGKITPL
jgi:integrase